MVVLKRLGCQVARLFRFLMPLCMLPCKGLAHPCCVAAFCSCLRTLRSFSQFFGGGFGGQEEERTPKGHDVYADLYVSLKDLYLGKELKVWRCGMMGRAG